MYLLVFERAWRCQACGTRFYARAGSSNPVKRPAAATKKFRLSKKQRRLAIQIGLGLGLLLVFYLFLHYITQERTSGGEGEMHVPRPAVKA